MFFGLFKNKEKEQLKLPYQVDIHSHIIPGVDDGSQDIETSVFLAKKMTDWGITKAIATPHRTDVTFENSPETINKPYEELCKALLDNNINLDLHYSFEYRMDEGFINLKNNGLIRPLHGKFILIENSFVQPLWNLDQFIADIKQKGYFPIWAHPERYTYYFQNKSIYKQIHDMGCQFQVNVLSIAGCYGREVQDIALDFLKKGYLTYLGTDLHHGQHVKAMDEFLRSNTYKKLKSQLEDYILNDQLL